MKQFLDFILKYYQIIISALTMVFTLVLFFIKKRPSSAIFSELKLKLTEKLPALIVSAETIFDGVLSSGVSKKDLVISLSLENACKILGRKLKSDEVISLTSFISDQIELILSTPLKKEVNNG